MFKIGGVEFDFWNPTFNITRLEPTEPNGTELTNYIVNFNHLILQYSLFVPTIKQTSDDRDPDDHTLLYALFHNRYLTIDEKIQMLRYLHKTGLKLNNTHTQFEEIISKITDVCYVEPIELEDMKYLPPSYSYQPPSQSENLSYMTNKVKIMASIISLFGYHSTDQFWSPTMSDILRYISDSSVANSVETELIYLFDQFDNFHDFINSDDSCLLTYILKIDSPIITQYVFNQVDNITIDEIAHAFQHNSLETVTIVYNLYNHLLTPLKKTDFYLAEENQDERVQRWFN